MKEITRYFYMTLIVVQILFVFLWYFNINAIGILSWIGKGSDYNPLKLFLPLIVYGVIKILYWFADPLSALFSIILRWVVIIGVFYLFVWLFLK